MPRARRPRTHPLLDQLVGYALRYYRDFVKPAEELPAARRAPSARRWRRCPPSSARLPTGQRAAIPTSLAGHTCYQDRARAHAFKPLRAWFSALYEVLLGQEQGPRFGGFIELYGVENTRALIERALKGELAAM